MAGTFASERRRLKVAAAYLGLLLAGAAFLYMAWAEYPDGQKTAFRQSVLVNAGVATILFVPLWLVQRSLGRRLEGAEIETQQVREDIAEVRHVLAGISPGGISEAVQEGLRERRQPDIDLFARLHSDVTQEVVRSSLARAAELGLLSRNGFRVEVPNSYHVLRFRIPDPGSVALHIDLETDDSGVVKREIEWHADASAAALGVEVAQALNEFGMYPGDGVLDFGQVFDDLATAVDLAYESKTGSSGATGSLWPLVQCFGQWAITDLGVEVAERQNFYQISKSRFGEHDWDPHVTNKGWVDVVSFRRAFETAKELDANGKL